MPKIERIGLYPGTFDPITIGHFDIIQRGAHLVDRLIVGVAKNAGKGPLFDLKARLAMVEHDLQPLVKKGMKIEVRPFENLLMHFAAAVKASVIIRGLRAVSDFEYEFQMTGMNYRLDPSIETVFLMSTDRSQFVSSRLVKEIARLNGDIRPFVSPFVAKELTKRFSKESGRRKVNPEIRD